MGMEALLRWEPPGQPIRAAQDFIQEAEHIGLITELGRVTIADAICTINPPPAQLEQPDIVNQFSSALAEHHLPAGVIGIEIAEAVILSDDPIDAAIIASQLFFAAESDGERGGRGRTTTA